jgi:hypothetical protein
MKSSIDHSGRAKPLVFILQLVVLLGFTGFASSMILWIGRLIYVSWDLDDSFSGSIGIALVAGSIFFILIYLFNYLFWGLRVAGRKSSQ